MNVEVLMLGDSIGVLMLVLVSGEQKEGGCIGYAPSKIVLMRIFMLTIRVRVN
jgi:hypothetical protein